MARIKRRFEIHNKPCQIDYSELARVIYQSISKGVIKEIEREDQFNQEKEGGNNHYGN